MTSKIDLQEHLLRIDFISNKINKQDYMTYEKYFVKK